MISDSRIAEIRFQILEEGFMRSLLVGLSFLFSVGAFAHMDIPTGGQIILTDLSVAKALDVRVLSSNLINNTAIVEVSPEQLMKLSRYNHTQGKCAGYEALTFEDAQNAKNILMDLQDMNQKIYYASPMLKNQEIIFNNDYQNIINQASPEELKKTIQWLSSYPNRYNRAPNPNVHVYDLKTKLEEWLKDAPWKYEISVIDHTSTKQKSLSLKILGTRAPNEVIVLGGHLDSINQGFFGIPIPGMDKAPGADDNASGSSNLIEALKLLKQQKSFERTVEFYWYAGEESGLLGSAEIAKDAKAKAKKIIAVLQLDMTLYPGEGEQVMGLMTDFTSPWLRAILTQLNNLYVKARFIESQCGYGCSDHASWHRQGFHAVTPFEATFNSMNNNLHTERDVLDSKSSLTHSNSFTKFATLFALHLANSSLEP